MQTTTNQKALHENPHGVSRGECTKRCGHYKECQRRVLIAFAVDGWHFHLTRLHRERRRLGARTYHSIFGHCPRDIFPPKPSRVRAIKEAHLRLQMKADKASELLKILDDIYAENQNQNPNPNQNPNQNQTTKEKQNGEPIQIG